MCSSLPSFFEGVPLVLLEAMACGCRVIATEVPGVRELLETDFSPWVKTLPTPLLREVDRPLPGTEKSFEDHFSSLLRIQIQAVLDEPAIPADEIRRFLEPFTWARVFSRIERAYQNLIAPPPRPCFLEKEENMDCPDHPFWNYSVTVHGQPGAHDAGLVLQSRYAVDAKLLFFLLLGRCRGRGTWSLTFVSKNLP